MRTTEIEQDPCPFCGHMLDRVTAGPENPEAVPQEGDFTLCIQCGGLLVFDERVRVRPPTNEEQVEAMTYPEVVRVMTAIAKAHGGTGHGDDA
jgi:hypothetical protein